MSCAKKPKICYFRGSYLNPFEVQYLEPLAKEFDLSVAYTRSHRFQVDSIALPKITVNCVDYANGLIPRKINGRHIPNIMKGLGYDEVILGRPKFVESFDVIHAQEQSFFSTWQIAREKRRSNFKLVVVQCEVNPYWYLEKAPIGARARFVREQADLFIARSERARAALICEGVSPERIRVAGHGVSIDRFHPGSKDEALCNTLGIETGRFIILFVGHLLWTKGVFSLATAAKWLLKDPEIQQLDPLFVLVGDGDDRHALAKYIRTLQLERNFVFAGRQSYNDLPDIHRLADIFVLPSISTRYILEQFGIVLIESMASGKPVISTYCGAIDEVVGDAGLLVQPNDYLQLSVALERLCKDEALRQVMGRRGLERVHAHFSNISVSEKIASAYREVLSL